jgi:hypothetical protein
VVKTIKDLFNRFFKQYNYLDYDKDIKRLYIVQNEISNWIDISKLNNLISERKIAILKNAYLLEEISEESIHLIKLTETGVSLATDSLLKDWENDIYFHEFENQVLIPFNCNPMLLSKYIFDDNFVLKERDFLIVLERKGLVV